jgi:hypothetical protein
MCCCDCLLVEALQEAAQAEAKTAPQREALAAATGAAMAPAVMSVDRIPQRLCEWSMLALLRRRRPVNRALAS